MLVKLCVYRYTKYYYKILIISGITHITPLHMSMHIIGNASCVSSNNIFCDITVQYTSNKLLHATWTRSENEHDL